MRTEEYVVVFQLIPTLVSGLTVKVKESFWTEVDGVTAPWPIGLIVENRATSRKNTVRYLARTRTNVKGLNRTHRFRI